MELTIEFDKDGAAKLLDAWLFVHPKPPDFGGTDPEWFAKVVSARIEEEILQGKILQFEVAAQSTRSTFENSLRGAKQVSATAK